MMGFFCECCVVCRGGGGGVATESAGHIYVYIIYILHLNLTAASIRSRANLFLV